MHLIPQIAEGTKDKDKELSQNHTVSSWQMQN